MIGYTWLFVYESLRSYQRRMNVRPEQCPLRFAITKSMTYLSPSVMGNGSSSAICRLESLVFQLIDCNRLHSGEAEAIKEEYQCIIAHPRVVGMLENFNDAEDRLDDLFVTVF